MKLLSAYIKTTATLGLFTNAIACPPQKHGGIRGSVHAATIGFILLAIICAAGGCAGVHTSSADSRNPAEPKAENTYWQRVEDLSRALAILGPASDSNEARLVAETAIGYSTFLAQEYRLVRPPFLHNVMVRLNLKDRGLCYHWTEDLMQRLEELELKNYRLHWAVAYRGSELREHNSVVITANGNAFEQGMVLDPWRYSGKLFFSPVTEDRYPWQELSLTSRR
jgi:hypothetical protein